MKKGQLIHTDNLILRIIVTFLGTFGAASIIETITYPLADMGFIGFVSLIFSVVYTFMLSCYGKNARLIRIMGMAVLPVVYLVINIGSFINGITTFINVFISRASFTGPVDSSNVLTVGSAGAASVRCVCVVVVIIIAVLAALEVNVFPNMLVSLAITMPLLSVFIAAVIVPDIISIIFCVLFIFDSMALRNKKIKTNQGAKTAVIISAIIAAVLTFIIPQETYKRNSFFDDARNMVTDVVYDRFGIDLQGNKSETEDDKAKVNATVGIGNGDVGQVDEVYYGNVYAGELNTMSDIGIAYAKVFMGRDFKNNSWQRWSDTRETQYSYESAVSEFALNLVKRKIYTLDEDEQLLADRFFYYQQTFRSKDGNVYGSSLDYRIARGSFEDYSRMGQLMKKYRNSAIVNSYESYAHGQYLDVSEDDRIVVAQLFGKRNLQTVDEKVEYIQKIVSYLKDNYTYTLKPGRVPEGKSVVEYFLRESKRGYCTYFATSAAVILRCAGIPARYCAGYTVNTNTGAYYTDGQSNKYMKYDVYDNAAHAWVEAYIDGYGWVIVDATPGYGEVEDTEQSSTQDESERQSQSDNSNSSVDENMTVDDTDEPGTESTAQEAVSDTDSFSGEIHINSVLIVVCTAMLAFLILIAMAAIRIVSRIHLLRSSSVDEVKLMKMYSYLEKLLACLGYKREPEMDYEEYIIEITAQNENLKNMGLEKAVQIILAVRFGNVKCVDKVDITGIISTIRQVRSYALKKARGLRKLIVCLI